MWSMNDTLKRNFLQSHPQTHNLVFDITILISLRKFPFFYKHIEGILKNIDINKNIVSLSHGIPLEWARVQYNKKPGSPFSEAMFSLEGIGNCISHNSGGWAGGGTPYSRVNVHWFENLGVDGMILFLQILFYNTYCAASDFQNR